MPSESSKLNAGSGHGREPLSCKKNSRKPPRAPHSGAARPDQGARLNVRNTKVGVNPAGTVPDEAEHDARTLYCEWNEHGERLKPFRKRVLESKTYDWNHGRVEGAPYMFAHL